MIRKIIWEMKRVTVTYESNNLLRELTSILLNLYRGRIFIKYYSVFTTNLLWNYYMQILVCSWNHLLSEADIKSLRRKISLTWSWKDMYSIWWMPNIAGRLLKAYMRRETFIYIYVHRPLWKMSSSFKMNEW